MIAAAAMVAWMAVTERSWWLAGWVAITALAVGAQLLDAAPVAAVETALMMACLAPVVGWASGGRDEA